MQNTQTTYGVFVLFQVVVHKKVRKWRKIVAFLISTFELVGIIRNQNKTRLYWRVCLSWLGQLDSNQH